MTSVVSPIFIPDVSIGATIAVLDSNGLDYFMNSLIVTGAATAFAAGRVPAAMAHRMRGAQAGDLILIARITPSPI